MGWLVYIALLLCLLCGINRNTWKGFRECQTCVSSHCEHSFLGFPVWIVNMAEWSEALIVIQRSWVQVPCLTSEWISFVAVPSRFKSLATIYL